MTPISPGEESIDPGFNVPVYSEGIRFSGSFLAPEGLENALLTSGGVVQLQIYGTVDVGGSPIHDPHFAAVLLPVPEPSTWTLFGFGLVVLFRRFRTLQTSAPSGV